LKGVRGPKADEAVKLYETVIANVVELGQLKDFDEDAKRVFVADHLSFKAIRYFGNICDVLNFVDAFSWDCLT
jgi:hypothetical protein